MSLCLLSVSFSLSLADVEMFCLPACNLPFPRERRQELDDEGDDVPFSWCVLFRFYFLSPCFIIPFPVVLSFPCSSQCTFSLSLTQKLANRIIPS